jgi:uncharacterized membrane protein
MWTDDGHSTILKAQPELAHVSFKRELIKICVILLINFYVVIWFIYVISDIILPVSIPFYAVAQCNNSFFYVSIHLLICLIGEKRVRIFVLVFTLTWI